MIVAGASLSLTGRYALQGRQAMHGLRLWEIWVNEGGGLLVGSGEPPRPISLQIYDDRSRIDEARTAVRRLLTEDRVDLLFGPYSSALTLAVAPVADAHGKILWNHGGSSDEIHTQGWQYLIAGPAPASTYFASLPAWLRKVEPGIDGLLVLHAERGTFARQVARGLTDAAEREGFRAVASVPCDLSRVDLSVISDQESDDMPQALVLVGSHHDEIRWIQTREAFPANVRRIAAVSAGLTAFGEAVGALAEGIIGSSQWEPGMVEDVDVGPTGSWVLPRFRQAFGQEPEYPAMQALAMGLVAGECMRRAGSLRDEALREAAAGLDGTTCFGRFRIDEKTGQQIAHRPVLVEWRGGEKKVVWGPSGP